MKKSSDWRISLIITTYHKDREMAKLTERCIASLNTRGIDEIIVVDDSEDGTFDVLKKWKLQISNLKL